MPDHDPLRYLRDGTLYTFCCVPELEGMEEHIYFWHGLGTRGSLQGSHSVWTKSYAAYKRVLLHFNDTHERFRFVESQEDYEQQNPDR